MKNHCTIKTTAVSLLFTCCTLFAQRPGAVNPERLMQYAADLSSPEMKGRLTGTSEGKLAESYLTEKMNALKLDLKLQTVTFPLYEVHPSTHLQSLDSQGRVLRSFEYIDEYREVDFSGSGLVNGKLVFAGYGVKTDSLDPYAGIDVKGNIVVLLSGIPASAPRDIEYARIDKKIDLAVSHGAAAMILIPTGPMAEMIAQKTVEARMWALGPGRTFAEEYYHEDFPAVFLHTAAVKELTGSTTETLMQDDTSRDLEGRVSLEIRATVHKQAQSRNIIGMLPGSDPELAAEAIIIGAHYDHLGIGGDGRIFYGAADNAAGAAAVLEAATCCSRMNVKPRRTIIFALWCGEEQGLFGSRHYVLNDPLHPLEQTKLMIQLDYLDNEYGPCLTNLDDKPIIQTFVGNAVTEEKLIALDWKGQSASDDFFFLQKNIPAYRFIAYGQNHHRDSDIFENLSKEMLTSTTELLLQGIQNTAY